MLFFSPLNSSMTTFKLRWKTDIYLKIWGSCETPEIGLFAASHCFLLCYFVVETGHNATLLAVQLFFFFFTIFVGISGHELVHMLESNPHKIWQVYIYIVDPH